MRGTGIMVLAVSGLALLAGCEKEAPRTPGGLLRDAAEQGDAQQVRRLLDGGKVNVNDKNDYDASALHNAARYGHPEVVKALLDKGADINAPNFTGCTPLHFAVMYGHTEVARLLIARGAAPNLTDGQGRTPMQYATLENNRDIVDLLRSAGVPESAADQAVVTNRRTPDSHGLVTRRQILPEKGGH